MQKFYSIFPKGKRRQLNFYSPCDAFFTNQITENNIFKHHGFDSDCLNVTEFDCDVMLGPKTDDTKKSQDFSLSQMEERKYSSGKKNNSRKKVYVINISNSKNFHIGPQKTININDKQLSRGISQPNIDLRKLLEHEEKLTEVCIILISLHLHDQWKEFIKCLGLEDTTLQSLELRNDKVRAFIIYDALQEYLNLFPNTSLGFIINALNEIHQIHLIEMLAQELNMKSVDF